MASSPIDQDNKNNIDNNNINKASTAQSGEENNQNNRLDNEEENTDVEQQKQIQEKKEEKIEEKEEEKEEEKGEKEENSKVKNDTIENKSSEEDIKAAWTQAWDDNSQAYYWWNTITYESSWEDPNDMSTAAASTEDSTITSAVDDKDKNNDTTIITQEELNPYEAIVNTELDSVLDTIDREVKAKLDGKDTATTNINNAHSYNPSLQPSSSLNYDYNYYNTQQHQYGTTDPYRFQAHFNTKTGRFQTNSDTEQYTMESRAKRQMDHYFDSDAYQEQRNKQLHRGQKRPLSKKEVERFKQAKKEKKVNKMRGWLQN